jgi:hypothetical protein
MRHYIETNTIIFYDLDSRELLRVRPNPLSHDKIIRLRGKPARRLWTAQDVADYLTVPIATLYQCQRSVSGVGGYFGLVTEAVPVSARGARAGESPVSAAMAAASRMVTLPRPSLTRPRSA